ncbi:virulence factor TspB C-terminal domain-related protein [Dokdonella soli]|uniref:Uncharacterized protein n=1 Tax=Dokdonella soli TaxID=529810 RepID=A0ABP3TJV7_9GAMM
MNGQCSHGGPSNCNPATDPNQCNGTPKGNAGGGETCRAPPFCSGDPIQCQVLQQAYNTRCAVENLGKWPQGEPVPDGHDGESPGDTHVVHDNSGELLGQVSSSGFLGGGSCPKPPTFSAMGHTFDFASQSWWCDGLSILGGIILFVGAFLSMRILSGG